MRAPAPLLALALLSCTSERGTPPPVQPSSPEAPSVIVRGGRGQAFAPTCLIVEVGATVEWRNLTPLLPVIVLSAAAPYELSSPALAAPYNVVPPERSDECVRRTEDGGACAEARPFSYWRHTFAVPGIFDYRDTSGGVVSSGYSYGMPAGTPVAASAATGTVCVRQGITSKACEQVCCIVGQAGACAPGVSCVGGRCGGVK
jgi:hypothetical protein